MKTQPHLIAVGLGRGNVIFDGTWDWCPLGMHQTHDVVAELGACTIQGGVLVFVQVNDDLQLRHIVHLLNVLLGHHAKLVRQLSAGRSKGFHSLTYSLITCWLAKLMVIKMSGAEQHFLGSAKNCRCCNCGTKDKACCSIVRRLLCHRLL